MGKLLGRRLRARIRWRTLYPGCANPFWHKYENWVKGVISFKEECPMAHATVAAETPFQHLILEQALAYAQQMERTADDADDGTVLDLCESLTLTKGRDLLRNILKCAVQQQADQVEKKGRRPGRVSVDTPAVTKADRHARS